MGAAQSDLTDPDDAARYLAETGADALSVSIGNVHIMADDKARFDLERLGRAFTHLTIRPFALL